MSDASLPPHLATAKRLLNTHDRFGGVAKTFHWLTALLILTMIPLGIVAQYWPYDTSEALNFKATLFSLHKTLGLVTFAVALTRILWAISQPRPVHLTKDSPLQTFAADAVHWSLYGALVLVPLSGWIHHAASTGFAPIWWPFGQTLPFVPQSQAVADAFAGLHLAFNILLVASLVLHIAGAVKHHVVDRDATLKRMLPGQYALPTDLPAPHSTARPAAAAFGVWALAVALGLTYGLAGDRVSATASLTAAPSQWMVEDGTLGLTVTQLGQPVSGTFGEWVAAIDFDETPRDGQHGSVSVTVAVPSLTLGGVTEQALGAEFLNTQAFATAVFSGPILADEDGDGYVVDGEFSLVGTTLPLRLPFDLDLTGDVAVAEGSVRLDRRDFGMGQTYTDESTVGFGVTIDVALTARRDAE
ncbi:MAG: cytochrome b/b6 domain-containing protein [Pseudomonadota bacterium]